MSLDLWYIPFSPWSLKARAALRHHGIEPVLRSYAPLVDEIALRLKLGKLIGGRITVPVLFTPEGPLTDSFAIAEYADQKGRGAKLFSAENREAVATWNAASERLLAAGRFRSMLRALEREDVLRESAPGVLRVLPLPLLRASIRAFNFKYDIKAGEGEAQLAIMREELTRLRAALSDGRTYLLGTLSYADFVMASALQLVSPLPGTPGLGPASIGVATEHGLAGEFADLLAWRDRLHAKHPLLPE